MTYAYSPYTSEILNSYLYNQTSKPTDLTNQSLIRPVGTVKGTDVVTDQTWYMTQGPGQYGYACLSPIVQAFFEKDDAGNYINAIPITTSSRLDKTGVKALFPDVAIQFSIQQYDYDQGTAGYAERVFIWGSSGFSLDDAVRFHVDANGDRYIANLAVRPLPVIDTRV